VLEMGEQIKIVDLARNLIRLSGLIPDEDIAISFVGLRPGEKLFEELVGHEETIEQSKLEKILKVKSSRSWNPYAVMPLVALLERSAALQDIDLVINLLRELVPTFTPTVAYALQEAERVSPGTLNGH
jgi:FlaA1/EpsC-like NDP-sugar epimerase